MTLVIRGLPGIREEIIDQRNRIANRLLADDKAREQSQRHLRLFERARLQGEIAAYNNLLALLNDAKLLSEADYDKLEARFTPVLEQRERTAE